MKSLRIKKHWSQEQLAQLSDLNVCTIQRAEKGENVGIETLKCLAAVFEISIEELKNAIRNEQSNEPTHATSLIEEKNRLEQAKEQVKNRKYFYAFSTFLMVVFLLFMLPNYNDGENLAPLIVVFVSFSLLIAGLALYVFKPFGEEWEKEKVVKMLARQTKDNDIKK